MALATRIESVHVHRDGAVITRVGSLAGRAEGSRTVRVGGLPLLLDDGSVQLGVEGPAVAVDLRISLEAAALRGETPDEEALRAAELSLAKLEHALLHVDRVRAMVERASVYRRPPATEGVPPPQIDVAARLSLLDFRVQEMERLAGERAQLAREVDQAQRRVIDLRERVQRTEGARAPAPDELRKAAVFTLQPREGSAELTVSVRYAIPTARWAPSYALRIDPRADTATLELRALVQQASGEDWTSARVAVSSANLMGRCDLPELTSLRIGRAQPPPQRRWRPPPGDVGALFSDYKRARRRGAARPAARAAPPAATRSASSDDATPTALRSPVAAPPPPMQAQAFAALAPGGPPPMGGAARGADVFGGAMLGMGSPPPATAPPPPRDGRARALTRSEAGPEKEAASAAPPIIEPDERLLAFGGLRMPSAEAASGQLRFASREEVYLDASRSLKGDAAPHLAAALDAAQAQATRIMQRRLPRRYRPPEPVAGFDALYEAAAPVDVPSDGDLHAIPLSASTLPCALRFVVVPRETQDVFRVAELESPLEVPLLPGPCDVYVGGGYLLGIELRAVAPRGAFSVGLGVEQAIKVARNVWFQEEKAGLMGGSLVLRHQIRVELISHKAEAADVEVRERVPVAAESEEDLRVEVIETKPPWRPWEPPASEEPLRGGYAWRVRLEPKAKLELHATYAVKLPAKLELLGGNRRD